MEIVNTYYHPTKPYEYVVIEARKNGQTFKHNVVISDFILDLVTIPAKAIPDSKLFKRAEEYFLARYK